MRKIPLRQKLEIVTRGAKQSLQISEVARNGDQATYLSGCKY